MIEINLVPDVKQELIRAETVRGIVISTSFLIGLISIGVVVILSAYVFGVQTVRSVIADEGIKKGGAQLASVKDLSKVLTIQNQLTKINSLNDQKKIDSRVFDLLLAVLPTDTNQVQLSGVTIDATASTITLEGQAGGGFQSLEVLRKTINNAVVLTTVDGKQTETRLASEINTSDVSFGEDNSGKKVLRFTLRFTYDEILFSPQVQGVTIKINDQGNATDSYIGVPRSIFTDRAVDLEGEQ
jgi:hypothetical protein